MALTGFYAFASASQMVVDAARLVCAADLSRTRSNVVKSWEEMDIAGRFISSSILNDIDDADFLLADISTLNFNVVYEIGYAIGRSKRVILVKHRALSATQPTIQEVGIFDTIGYKEYANSEELIRLVASLDEVKPIHIPIKANEKTPVYLVQPKIKTDYDGFLISAIKKSYLFFRSFDPSESPRISGPDAVDNVAESLAVVLHFLPREHIDSGVHNIRSAFVAGLADGMEKRVLFVQTGDTPIPIDLRDFVVSCRTEKDFQKAAAKLAEQLYEDRSQAALPLASPGSLLEELDLGASAAENEIASLGEYYMEIDAFRRAQRKEVRLVTGRKGSGKTAIFFTLRDRVRAQKRNVVLDLKPEGYQLMKLKDTVVQLLSAGTAEHTVTAFWEYLLWLELCYKLIEKDQELHKRNHLLFEPYQRLKAAYLTNEYSEEGDFSERLKKLLRDIAGVLEERYGSATSRVDLSTAQITEVIYRHDFSKLKSQILEYLKHKEELWLLFDNLDKGWASQGVSADDLVIVRALIEATRKLEREFSRLDISAHTIVFLRNDVFEHLVDSTADRGKETRANVDWDDQEQLRELVRRRVVRNLPEGGQVDFGSAWTQICTPIVEDQDSAQYLIDRCLMRPRSLLDLIGHCRGYALNLGHARIEKDDILKGCSAFSNDLLAELDLEIRDVFPSATNVLYAFIGASPTLARGKLIEILDAHGVSAAEQDSMIDLLLWFGFLGLVAGDGVHKYIYSFHYNMKVLEGTHRVLQRTGVTYAVNPAFAPSLWIR